MLNTLFATKTGMTQAWDTSGKRLAVTRLVVDTNAVLSKRVLKAKNRLEDNQVQDCLIFELGYGKKKLENCTKPIKSKVEKAGFSQGFKKIVGLKFFYNDENKEEVESLLKPGDIVKLSDVLEVGDVVSVQGKTKGKGFAGVMKRHGFHGGPRTHGQSDRQRAPGAIGCRTTPGRVFLGHRMAGHMGDVLTTVKNLVVLHIDLDKNEIWLNGPIPGYNSGLVKISKTGEKKTIQLNKQACGIKETVKEDSQAEDQQDQSEEVKKEEN